MTDRRITVWRELADGTVTVGSALLTNRGRQLTDFRDEDGNDWVLPPGASFSCEFERGWLMEEG